MKPLLHKAYSRNIVFKTGNDFIDNLLNIRHIAELTGDLALIMDFRGSERTIIKAKSPVERVVISSVAADGHSFDRFTCQLGIISALRASEAH